MRRERIYLRTMTKYNAVMLIQNVIQKNTIERPEVIITNKRMKIRIKKKKNAMNTSIGLHCQWVKKSVILIFFVNLEFQGVNFVINVLKTFNNNHKCIK